MFDALNKAMSSHNINRDSPINHLDIQVAKEEAVKNLSHKTPAKRKVEPQDHEEESKYMNTSTSSMLDHLTEKMEEDPRNLLILLQSAFAHSDQKTLYLHQKFNSLYELSLQSPSSFVSF